MEDFSPVEEKLPWNRLCYVFCALMSTGLTEQN
jgi:hypothetical protein